MSPEQSLTKIGKSVGEKLRAARIAQHYTQSQLATPDFSVSYISAIERGQIHPSLRALEILAVRLGLSSTQLLPMQSQQEERLSSSRNRADQDADELELALLEAHIQIRQDHAEYALAQLEKLSTKQLQPLQQLQRQYLLAWAYCTLAQFQESDYLLIEAIQLAKDLNALYMHIRILHMQALVQVGMRNYAQAIQVHLQCLEILNTSEPNDPFFIAQIYMSMGQHHARLEHFSQALEMFGKAIVLIEQMRSAKEVQATYVHISQQYSTANDYDLATLYAYKSRAFYFQETKKHLQGVLYASLGHALLKEDRDKARAFFDEALQMPPIVQDPLTHASILARYAEWYLGQHALDEAERSARQARELTQDAGASMIRADTLILSGRIAYAQHHYAHGDTHFTDGLEMLDRLRCHEELSNEFVRYAELLEQAGKAHEAFTYFRRAFQSQQHLGK